MQPVFTNHGQHNLTLPHRFINAFSKIIARINRIHITAPDGLRVIALPYLILLKLLARRNRDILDIEEMLQYCDEPKIAKIRSTISEAMPILVEDLERPIAISQMD